MTFQITLAKLFIFTPLRGDLLEYLLEYNLGKILREKGDRMDE